MTRYTGSRGLNQSMYLCAIYCLNRRHNPQDYTQTTSQGKKSGHDQKEAQIKTQNQNPGQKAWISKSEICENVAARDRDIRI